MPRRSQRATIWMQTVSKAAPCSRVSSPSKETAAGAVWAAPVPAYSSFLRTFSYSAREIRRQTQMNCGDHVRLSETRRKFSDCLKGVIRCFVVFFVHGHY